MIQLFIKKSSTDSWRQVQLKPGTTLSVERNSPIFDDEGTSGDLSYPFNVPAEPNRALFGFIEMPQAQRSAPISYECTLYDGPVLILMGLLKIRRTANKEYVVNVTGQVGAFAADFSGKKLKEIDLGSQTIPGTSVASLIYFTNVPDRHLASEYLTTEGGTGTTFRLRALSVGSIYSVAYQGTVAATLQALSAKVILENTFGYKSEAKGSSLAVIPAAAGNHNFQLEINTDYYDAQAGMFKFAQEQLSLQQLTYTSIAPFPNATVTRTGANYMADKFVFPTIYNPAFYPEENSVFGKYINDYQSGYKFNTEAQPTRHTLVPMFFLLFIVRKLVETQGYEATGDLFDDPEVQQIIIYNLQSMDYQSPDLEVLFNSYNPELKFSAHLPDMTCGEFFNEIRRFFGVALFFDLDQKVVRFKFMKNILRKGAEVDLKDRTGREYSSDLVELKRLRLKFALDAGDARAGKKDDAGVLIDPIFADYGDGEEYPVAFSPLPMETLFGKTVPVASQAGVSPLFNLGKNTFGGRLLFWKGLQPDATGKLYPAAGTELNGKKLQWNGAGGLVDQYWRELYELKTTSQPIEKEVIFDRLQLQQLDFSKKHHSDGLSYLIGQVSISLPIQKKAKVKLYNA